MPHKHKTDHFEVVRIFEHHPKYKGESGERAFLYRVCLCKTKKVADYGHFQAMEAKKAALEVGNV